jgi:heavy metal translocating P-type ATPase
MAADPINQLSEPNSPVHAPEHKQVEQENQGEHQHRIERADLVRIAVVTVAAVLVWFRVWEPFARFSIIGVAATLIGGYPIFREAAENIFERRMTMELSMTIALVAALAISEFFTALVITLFVLVAEILEGLNVSRGRRAIEGMLDTLPQRATVIRAGEAVEVAVSQLEVGAVLLIKPGTRLPVDGLVVGGHSFIDQSAITGESAPAEKIPGTQVFAGTINQSGALEVVAERLGRDTTFGKIIEAVERAEQSRAPIQKTADRLAGYLVYFALGAAILTFIITRNARSTISVIIVAGACGIAAGTPLAILGAIGRAARAGSIIKGGLYLELLATLDTVLLDKTGTVTYGLPVVSEINTAEGVTEQLLLKIAATAESRSEHPVAKAVLKRAADYGSLGAEPEQFEYRPGRGVLAGVNGTRIAVGNRALFRDLGLEVPPSPEPERGSEILVANNGAYMGSLTVADELRPEALNAVLELKAMGLNTILLTGDAKKVANWTAKALNVDWVFPEMLPEEKMEYVEDLVARGRRVAMVGDGVNDAPALAEASVGVAMGSGTDVARESADVVLIGSDLSKFVETIKIARRCRRIIMQNFWGTLIVDSIGVGMAAVGFLNPLLAAFIHVSSELTFILNSTRLLPRRT